MTRRRIVVFAVVASLLLMSAPTATVGATAPSDNLVVGSQWTDFGTGGEPSPQTLENLSVSGTGDSSTITLQSVGSGFSDSFEDEATDSGIPDNWEAYETSTDYSASVISTDAVEGSQSFEFTSGDDLSDSVRPQEQPSAASTDSVTAYIKQDTATSSQIRLFESGTRKITVGMQTGDLVYYDGSYNTISTTPDANDWVRVTIQNIDPSTDSYAVEWSIVGGTSGSESALPTETSLDSGWETSALLTNDGRSLFDGFRIGQASLSSAQYVSATHEVTGAEEAAINIEQASNVSVDATVRTDGGTVLGTETYTSVSNHTLNISDTSSEDLETVLDIDITGSNPQFELADESILFTNHAPESGGDASPTGELTATDQTFKIDVTDPTFDTAQGDTVNASLYIDGTYAGSDSRSSNGSVAITPSRELTGGNHTYYWTFTDSYGATTQSSTYTIQVPDTLSIYQETQPTMLVNSTSNVTVTFFGSDQVYSRTTSDGTVDLTGLPPNEPLYVRAESDGYYTRTIFIESLYEQSRIYLLDRNVSAVQDRFTLEETPGYPQESTTLYIEKPLEINGSTDWVTIVSDQFGVRGVNVYLQEGQRYRLRIEGPNGEMTALGSYTATLAETIPLAPSQPSVNSEFEKANIQYGASETNTSLTYGFQSRSATDVLVTIYERGNTDNRLVANTTYDSVTDISHAIPLDPAEQNLTWVVEYHVTVNGNERVFTAVAGTSGVTTLPGTLSPMWRQTLVAGLMILFAAAFSVTNRATGALGVGVVGGLLWYLGFLSGIATPAAVSVSIGIGVYSMLNQRT